MYIKNKSSNWGTGSLILYPLLYLKECQWRLCSSTEFFNENKTRSRDYQMCDLCMKSKTVIYVETQNYIAALIFSIIILYIKSDF